MMPLSVPITPRLLAAVEFVALYEFLREAYGSCCAVRDSRMRAARRTYLRETALPTLHRSEPEAVA